MNTPPRDPWGRFLLRNFITYNPLFLLSATVVLGSAWLLNPPAEAGGRSLPLLLQLFAVIQVYEFALLGAAGILAHKGGLERDVRNLHLVLAPFLLDVTFTTSSLSVSLLGQLGTASAAGLVGVILALTLAKLRLGLHLCGLELRLPQFVVLLAGPALATLTPLLGASLARSGLSYEVALLAGTGAGLLALAFGAAASDSAQGRSLRALAPLALIAALVHGSATAYTYSSPLVWVAGPLLLCAAPVLYRLLPRWVPSFQSPATLVLAGVGALLCAVPEQVTHASRPLTTLGLAGFTALAGVTFARTRSLPHLLVVLVGLRFSLGSGLLEETLRSLGSAPSEPWLLLALSGYGLWRKSHPTITGVPLALAAVLIARQEWLGGGLDTLFALQIFGAGLLALAHRHHGRSAKGAELRFLGALFLYLPAFVVALGARGELAEGARWLSRGGTLGLLGLAIAARQRAYALPALLIPLGLLARHAPETSQGWGVLGLGLAFGVVGLGVALSLRRDELLARLGAEPSEPSRRARPRRHRPGAWRRAGARLSVASVVVVASLALAPRPALARERTLAISTLRSIATAQTLYRESRKERQVYAPTLSELVHEGYLDPGLADGEHRGYRFELVRSDLPEFTWLAVARPIVGHKRASKLPGHFAINHTGEIVASRAPILADSTCQFPATVIRVSH